MRWRVVAQNRANSLDFSPETSTLGEGGEGGEVATTPTRRVKNECDILHNAIENHDSLKSRTHLNTLITLTDAPAGVEYEL